MFTIKMKFGSAMIEYQDTDIKKIHRFSSVWGMLPQICVCCKSPNVILYFKSPGGNDYYGVKCKDCGAEKMLHQHKEEKGGGFYSKPKDKMEVWQGKKEERPEEAPDSPNPFKKNDADLPFQG